jgi:putative IMPACT (imprinted ancient) family translation regulator
MAYRIWSEQRQLFDQDCDDDGESAAGGRLLHLLQIMNVSSQYTTVPYVPC